MVCVAGGKAKFHVLFGQGLGWKLGFFLRAVMLKYTGKM